MKIRRTHKKWQELFVWILLYRHKRKHQPSLSLGCACERVLPLSICYLWVCQSYTNQYEMMDYFHASRKKRKKENRSKTVQIVIFDIFSRPTENRTPFFLLSGFDRRKHSHISVVFCYFCGVMKSSFCSFSKSETNIFCDFLMLGVKQRERFSLSHSYLSI